MDHLACMQTLCHVVYDHVCFNYHELADRAFHFLPFFPVLRIKVNNILLPKVLKIDFGNILVQCQVWQQQ